MPAVNFTQKWLTGLKPPTDRPYREYKDSQNPWLVLWHRQTGSKTFFATGRLGGTGKFIRVKVPASDVKTARSEGSKVRTEIQEGVDRRAAKRGKRVAPSVEQVWEHYAENHLEKHKGAESAWYLRFPGR